MNTLIIEVCPRRPGAPRTTCWRYRSSRGRGGRSRDRARRRRRGSSALTWPACWPGRGSGGGRATPPRSCFPAAARAGSWRSGPGPPVRPRRPPSATRRSGWPRSPPGRHTSPPPLASSAPTGPGRCGRRPRASCWAATGRPGGQPAGGGAEPAPPETLTLLTGNADGDRDRGQADGDGDLRDALARGLVTGQMAGWVRDLVHTPAGVATPEMLADTIAARAVEHGAVARIWTAGELAREGFGGWWGSARAAGTHRAWLRSPTPGRGDGSGRSRARGSPSTPAG